MRLSRDDVAPILAIVLSGSLGVLVTVGMVSRLLAPVPAVEPLVPPSGVEVRPVRVETARLGPARTGTLTGKVFNANSGQPIAAAQVYIEALGIGVLTRADGTYLLLNVPAGQHVLTVQRIGYSKVSANVLPEAGGTATLDFRMSEEALSLDEVVVTVPTRATPPAQSPIIFVDGVRVETRNGSPSLDNIDPDIIEDITVLKGPNAVERYGADASGGAILVRTKQGAADPN